MKLKLVKATVQENSAVTDTFVRQNSVKFWLAVVLTGVGAGVSAGALYLLLEWVQRLMWPGSEVSLLQAAATSAPWRHLVVRRFATPVMVMGAIGIVSIPFPQLLGNGRDIAELAFNGGVAPLVLLAIFFLKPLATVFSVRSGAPGGLFTPSLTLGAMLGGLLGAGWTLIWPGPPAGLYAVLGAAAVLAATTQGPISTVVLMIEFTGHDRSFIVPLLVAVSTATLVSRLIEPRSIYDARLSDEQVVARLAARAPPAT